MSIITKRKVDIEREILLLKAKKNNLRIEMHAENYIIEEAIEIIEDWIVRFPEVDFVMGTLLCYMGTEWHNEWSIELKIWFRIKFDGDDGLEIVEAVWKDSGNNYSISFPDSPIFDPQCIRLGDESWKRL